MIDPDAPVVHVYVPATLPAWPSWPYVPVNVQVGAWIVTVVPYA